jgi:uncharacterized protein YndB with AHSA1/START domain
MPDTRIVQPPDLPQVIVEREFAAPAQLVLRAHLEPELLLQWLGPREMTMTVECYETRHGGTWRYVHQGPDGEAYAFRGVFHGEPSIAGIVQTFEYEGWPGRVQLDTITMHEHDGMTLLRTVSTFQSVDDRDAMVASGMERGARDSGQRLDALLATLTSTKRRD